MTPADGAPGPVGPLPANSLAALPHVPARAVVINVGTDLLATLAVASARRRAGMPVLLVNCGPTPASAAHWGWLAEEWGFDVVEQPTRTHGAALDHLFRELAADLVLLLDSDAEIRGDSFVPELRAAFEDPNVFGAGFVEGPTWLEPRFGVTERTCLYQERPWVPCVLLRSEHVRDALAAGRSFENLTIYNDVACSERLSRALAIRFQSPMVPRSRVLGRLPKPLRRRMTTWRLPWLVWARREYAGLRPNCVYCDTGADLYQWCRYTMGLVFVGEPNARRTRDHVVHFKGATRRRLGYGAPGLGVLDDLDAVVIERLATEYGLDWTWCERRVADR